MVLVRLKGGYFSSFNSHLLLGASFIKSNTIDRPWDAVRCGFGELPAELAVNRKPKFHDFHIRLATECGECLEMEDRDEKKTRPAWERVFFVWCHGWLWKLSIR